MIENKQFKEFPADVLIDPTFVAMADECLTGGEGFDLDAVGKLINTHHEKTQKHWENDLEKSQAFKILVDKEYNAGKPGTVAHHLSWKSLVYIPQENLLRFTVEFDCAKAVIKDGSVTRDYWGDEYDIFRSEMRFKGVKNLVAYKRTFNYAKVVELDKQTSSWKAFQKFVLSKPYHVVNTIYEDENGVVIPFRCFCDYKKKEVQYYELRFSYDSSENVAENIPDKNFQHWGKTFVKQFPKYKKFLQTTKFKNRQKRKPLKRKDEDFLVHWATEIS